MLVKENPVVKRERLRGARERRFLELLEANADSQPLTLRFIAFRLNETISATSLILRVLVSRGWVIESTVGLNKVYEISARNWRGPKIHY